MEPEGNEIHPIRRAKFIPIVWVGLGIALLIVSAVLAATWGEGTKMGTGTLDELVEWNVVEPGERVIVWADLSATHNLASGCAITIDEAVSWRHRQVSARVPIEGAPVELERTRVTIGGEVVCDFVDADAARVFATEAARTGAVPQG